MGQISIDKKLLRVALDWKNFVRCLPLWFTDSTKVTYDGEWLIVTQTSGYEAIGTGYGSPAYQSTRDGYSMIIQATIKMNNDTGVYVFFLEPRKAVFTEFQGFWNPSGDNHKFEFNNPGGGEEDAIADQDWTTEHIFKITHAKDQSACRGYIDGVMKAECTDVADISPQPFSIYCCEPNNTSRTMYLKYPPGIVATT